MNFHFTAESRGTYSGYLTYCDKTSEIILLTEANLNYQITFPSPVGVANPGPPLVFPEVILRKLLCCKRYLTVTLLRKSGQYHSGPDDGRARALGWISLGKVFATTSSCSTGGYTFPGTASALDHLVW